MAAGLAAMLVSQSSAAASRTDGLLTGARPLPSLLALRPAEKERPAPATAARKPEAESDEAASVDETASGGEAILEPAARRRGEPGKDLQARPRKSASKPAKVSGPDGGDEEEDSPWSAEAELDFASRYLWHGIALSDGPVFQPTLKGTAYGFSLAASGNLVLANDPDQGKFTEAGLAVGYSYSYQRLTLEPALELLTYPNLELATTAQVELAVTLRILDELSLVSTHSLDVLGHRGGYFGDLGLSLEHAFDDRWSLEVGTGIGLGSARFNGAYLHVAKTTLDTWESELAVSWEPWAWLAVQPHAQLVVILDPALLPPTEASRVALVGGIAFSFRL